MNKLPDISDSLLSMAIRYSELTETQKKEYPECYDYFWAKCSMMTTLGSEIYASQDFYKYPLTEWLTGDFNSSLNQVVNELRGSKGFPIEISSKETIQNLLLSMHFQVESTIIEGDFIEIKAHHLIEEDVIILYFRQTPFL